MLETTRVTDRLDLARQHAAQFGLTDQLEQRLDFLANYRDPNETRCTLRPDHSPHSFLFTMERLVEGEWRYWFNGGLIFHGPHDGNGNGSAPALAVTLEPHAGWSIHT